MQAGGGVDGGRLCRRHDASKFVDTHRELLDVALHGVCCGRGVTCRTAAIVPQESEERDLSRERVRPSSPDRKG